VIVVSPHPIDATRNSQGSPKIAYTSLKGEKVYPRYRGVHRSLSKKADARRSSLLVGFLFQQGNLDPTRF